jgi:hypothetical protein
MTYGTYSATWSACGPEPSRSATTPCLASGRWHGRPVYVERVLAASSSNDHQRRAHRAGHAPQRG